eukprot:Plantae.Rhodophyta-Hildenbrandia_rubra.ctg478.p1 GENE.Plantae.Rhodophyta-Hildenbrandia_rubra.ctg478~~Plantae.Rhodophyta-Hildenbrandia_rubra.ctg478.p1  ORF type:complete len:1249 (-),score=177.38 Plantae.Rhodophyta-Hildenbrandia_rubra.ctg478:3302-7048(-)
MVKVQPARRTIPLNQNALQLLTLAKKKLSPKERLRNAEKLSSSVIDQLESDSSPVEDNKVPPVLQYLLNRLIRGIAASHGGSRINFACILTTLIRTLDRLKDDGRDYAKQDLRAHVLTLIENVYGSGNYEGDDRERVLGIVCSTAALVQSISSSPSQWKGCDPSMLQRLLVLLSQAVCESSNKWIVGEATVQIFQMMLDSGVSVGTENAGLLMDWCNTRKHSSDGLALAVLLHTRQKVLDATKFQKLYPDVDTFCSSLFANGSASVRVHRTQEERFRGFAHEAYELPLSWELAVKFILKQKNQRILNATFAHFWKTVEQSLVLGESRGTQKILALQLVLFVYKEATGIDVVATVLSKRVAALLISMITSRKVVVEGSKVVGVLRTKSDEEAAIVKQFAVEFFSQLKNVTGANRSIEGVAFQNVLAWLIEEAALIPFTGDNLKSYFQRIDDDHIKKVLVSVVDAFANPPGKAAIDKYRINLLTLLSSLGEIDNSWSIDIAEVLLLYGFFTPVKKETAKIKKAPSALRGNFRLYHGSKRALDFVGVAPIPSPLISDHVATRATSSLFRILLSSTAKERTIDNWQCRAGYRLCEYLVSNADCALRNSAETNREISTIWTRYQERRARLEPGSKKEPLLTGMNALAQDLHLVALARGENNLNPEIFGDLIRAVEECMEIWRNGKVTDDTDVDVGDAIGGQSVTGARWARVLVAVALMPNSLLRKAALDSFEQLIKTEASFRLIDGFFEEVTAIFAQGSLSNEGENNENTDDDDDGTPLTAEEISASRKRMGIKAKNNEEIASSENKSGTGVGEKSTEYESDGGSDDSTSEDSGVELDSEDPAVLADLDRRLTSHFRMLFASRAQKRKEALRKLSLSEESSRTRIFPLMSTLVRILRVCNANELLLYVASRIFILSLSIDAGINGFDAIKRKIEELYRKQLTNLSEATMTTSESMAEVAGMCLSDVMTALKAKVTLQGEHDANEILHPTDAKIVSHIVPLLDSLVANDDEDITSRTIMVRATIIDLLKSWCLSTTLFEDALATHLITLFTKLDMTNMVLQTLIAVEGKAQNKPLIMTLIAGIDAERGATISKQVWSILQDRLNEHIFFGFETFIDSGVRDSILKLWLLFLRRRVRSNQLDINVVRRDVSSLLSSAEVRKRKRQSLRATVQKVFGRALLKRGRETMEEEDGFNPQDAADATNSFNGSTNDKSRSKKVGAKESVRDLVRKEAAKRRAKGWKPGDYYNTNKKRRKT